MEALELFAKIATAPFRIIWAILQHIIMLTVLGVFLIVAPFVSYFTMLSYQHDANTVLNSDISRESVFMDFGTNTMVGFSKDASFAYRTHVADGYDYKSANAVNHGTLPAQWGFFNLIGFYSDWLIWAHGKEAPMYAAYAEAATSSDNLRAALSELRPQQHIVLPDAPKIGMVWHSDPYPDVILFGVCPAATCRPADFNFREGHELFEPTLTEGQAAAVAQMQNTMSDDYWVKEAHANGITNRDYRVLIACHVNRMRLTEKYASTTLYSHRAVYLELAYLLLIVLWVVRVRHKRKTKYSTLQ
jgi:hypothetical protein